MKKYVFLASTILFFIVAQSCSQKKDKVKKNSKDYCTIIFDSNQKTIYVSPEYSYAEEWKNGKPTGEQIKLKFNNKECDSLLNIATRIITNPSLSKEHLTCGAGENIKIEISYCGTSIMCKYSSILSWSNLSDDNKKLYDLLNSKTPITK